MAPSVDNMPLDIHYAKVLEWLIERKTLPHDWQDKVRKIHEQMNNAISDFPDVAEISVMLKGKSLHYYHCKRMMKLLEAAQEGRAKNIFGMYTNNLLRSWAAVLKAYEKENVYLGEAGRIMIQNATYTCPSLKKNIAQYEKQIDDYSRKIVDYTRTIADFGRRFTEACKELKIDGKVFRTELVALTRELPSLYEEIEEFLKKDIIAQALDYYAKIQRFLHSHHQQRTSAAATDPLLPSTSKKEEEMMIFFDVLQRIRRGEKLKGSGSGSKSGEVGEEAPIVEIDWNAAMEGDEERAMAGNIDWDAATAGAENGAEGGEGVDWGDGGGAEQEGAAIDWDIGKGGQGEIDWGEAGPSAAPALDGGGEGGDGKEEVEWGIEVQEAGIAAAGAEEEKGGLCLEGDSLISNSQLRGELVNNLLELEAFLKQRRMELSDEDILAFVGQYQGSHAALQQQSTATVDRYLEAMKVALSRLRSKRFQQLIMIHSSSVYVDRLVRVLKQKLEHMAKLKKAIGDLEARREETISALGKATSEYQATAAATRTLKKQVQASISTLYNGRPINIMGEINTL